MARKRPLQLMLQWRSDENTGQVFGMLGLSPRGKHERRRLYVACRRLLLVLFAAAVVSWLGAATAYWSVRLRVSPYNRVTWADVALWPLRRAEIRYKRGLAYVDAGLDSYRRNDFRRAYMNLRAGVPHVPGNNLARLKLAGLCLALVNRPDTGFDLLEEGIPYGRNDLGYVEGLFMYATAYDNPDFAERCSKLLMEPPPENRACLRIVLQERLLALMRLRRFEEALAHVRPLNADPSAAWRSADAEALALFELGRRKEAVELLEKTRDIMEKARMTEGLADLLRAQIVLYRRDGNLFALEGAQYRLMQLEGMTPQNLLFLLTQAYEIGNPDYIKQAVGNCLPRLRDKGDALLMMQLTALQYKDWATVRSCSDAAVEEGYPRFPFDYCLASAMFEAGDYSGAARVLEAVNVDDPSIPSVQQTHARWLKTLVASRVTSADIPASVPHDFFGKLRLPVDSYLACSNLAEIAGGVPLARAVIRQGLDNYPFSLRLKTRLEALPEPGRVAVAVERMPAGEALPNWNSELSVHRHFEALKAAGDWPAVLASMRELFRARPSWLPGREDACSLLRIEAALRAGQTMEARGFISLFHGGEARRALQLRELGRQLVEAGVADAGSIIEEVIRPPAATPPAEDFPAPPAGEP